MCTTNTLMKVRTMIELEKRKLMIVLLGLDSHLILYEIFHVKINVSRKY